MSMLYPDALPKSVVIGGTEHPVRWKYYIVLEVLRLLDEGKHNVRTALDLFYSGGIPANIEDAFRGMSEFIKRAGWSNGYKEEGASEVPNFSWEHDAPFIWASMKRTYPAWDWSECHWWEFKAAFDGLPNDSKIFEVVRARQARTTSEMSSEQRKSVREAQARYALPNTFAKEKSAEELEAEYTELAKRQVLEDGGNRRR